MVVQAIRTTTSMKSRFRQIILECRDIIHRQNNVKLLFVKQSGNMVAHELARESYVSPGCSFDKCSISSSIKHCIELDLSI